MSRAISFLYDQLMTSSYPRQPQFKVFIYDFRTTGDTINQVVRGQPLDADTGPREMTEVVEVVRTDVAGDFVSPGIISSQLSLSINDPNNILDPMTLLLDPDSDGRWLRQGNGVRVIQGDSSIPEAQWPVVFTGKLIGSAGVDRERTSGNAAITCRALDRVADFLNLTNTTSKFGISTPFIQMVTDIATVDMGLDLEELELAGFGTRLTTQRATRFVKESPIVSIAKIMMVDGFMPRFNGEGKLTQTQGIVTGFPNRVYPTNKTIVSVHRPEADSDVVNSVCVLGLDANLSRIVQPTQDLLSVQITTGYFTKKEKVKVYWSEDRKLIAADVDPTVHVSADGALNFAGASENFEDIPAPGGADGTIGSIIRIDTGFTRELMISITVGYIAAAWIPDTVASVIVGQTVPVGRAAQAAVLVAILLLMTQIGRTHVTFRGKPTEYVYKEIRACARKCDIRPKERNEITVENHLISDQTTADEVARDILFRQLAAAHPRNIVIIDDVKLEADDIFQYPDPVFGDRRMLIKQLVSTMTRGGDHLMVIQAHEITAGLEEC